MNQKYADRSKYIPWIFIPTLLAIVIQTAISIFGLELYIVKALGETTSGNYTDFYVGVIKEFTHGNATAAMLIGYAVITTILGVWIFRTQFRDNKFSSLRGKSNNVLFTVLGLVIFVIGMQYVTLYLLNSLASAFPSWLEEYNELMETAGIDSDMTVLMTLYTVVFGPICEEILFRGITFSAAKKVMPVYFAILVQAIMFGAFHMNKLQGAYALVIGLGLGYIMYLYDNLFITIIAHVMYNLLGTIGSEYLPMQESGSLIVFFVASLASLIAVYASIIIMRKASAIVNNDRFFDDI